MSIKLVFGICAILNLVILVSTYVQDRTFDGGRFSAILGWSCAYMASEDK